MDLAQAYDEVVRITASSPDPEKSWAALVAYLESHAGTSFPSLRKTDVVSDIRDLGQQLEKLIQTAPPPANLNAIYFGLFDTADDGDHPRIGFYVAGVLAFDPEDGDSLCRPAWRPEGNYLSSASLDAVKTTEVAAESAGDTELASLLAYAGRLGAALIIARFASRGQLARLRRVVGFDSGDFAEIST